MERYLSIYSDYDALIVWFIMDVPAVEIAGYWIEC